MDRQRVAAELVRLAKELVAEEVPVSSGRRMRSRRSAESGNKEEYQKYFQKKLKETGKSSPSDMSDDEKKKFFEDIDKGWDAEKETD